MPSGNLDYGLENRLAIVCGSSAGLGRACAEALARAGASVVLNGRDEKRLSEVAGELSAIYPGRIQYVAADATDHAGRDQLLSQVPNPDILVNNAAGPPTGNFRDFDEHIWVDAVRRSMISPILMIRSVIDSMIQRRWGRIINITSSSVRAPLPFLGLSNGARNGLTGFVAGLAREVAAHGVTINNLLPGRIETDRLSSYIKNVAEQRGDTFEGTAESMKASNPMKRFGKPAELGAFCAFLASEHAAFVTGQNILIDGGEFPGI
jgi:3-oxoacyl-[acyl-carrier protein] reductase